MLHNNDRLEINEPNKVLVAVSEGRRYISQPDTIKVKPAQKGMTCWHKCFEDIRVRYGKSYDFGEDTPAGRKIEKILSNHRKRISYLDMRQGYFLGAIDYFNSMPSLKPQEIIQSMGKTKFRTRDEEKSFNDFKEALNDFENKKSTYITLENYLNYLYTYDKIIARENTLRELGVDPEDALKKIMTINGESIATQPGLDLKLIFGNLSIRDYMINMGQIDELTNPYANAITIETAKAYNLECSTWHPNKGFDALMHELRANGAMVFSGDFGRDYYSNPPTQKKNETFGKRAVYSWKPGEFIEDDSQDAHVILVIGLHDDGNNKFVYYLDPQDERDPKKQGMVYKISYKRFQSSIRDALGCKENEGGMTMHFAYHANNEWRDYKYNFHRLFKEANNDVIAIQNNQNDNNNNNNNNSF